jgi:hypothetical protein
MEILTHLLTDYNPLESVLFLGIYSCSLISGQVSSPFFLLAKEK